jgi:CRP/FNR family transcriptional regulator
VGGDRSSLQRTRPLRRLARDECVFEVGARPGLVGVLHRGYLRKEHLTEDGRRTILGLLGPGDVVGEMPGRVMTYSLETATDAELCAFPGQLVSEIARGNAAFWHAILDDIQRQYHQELAFAWLRSALRCRPRLLAFLLMAARIMPSAPQPDGSVIVSIPIGRRDWADLCNMTNESISRQMTHLSASGEVQSLGRGQYWLADPQALCRSPGLRGFPMPWVPQRPVGRGLSIMPPANDLLPLRAARI